MNQAVQGRRYRLLVAIFLNVLLCGCPLQLAPDYDKAVVDSLNTVSVETMTIMATATGGTTAATFSAREEKYNATIGKLDALTLLAGARPVPRNKVSVAINALLEKRGTAQVVDDDSMPPSVAAIKKVSEALAVMRDTDKKQGLTPTEVEAFKGTAMISFDQAITYENFLQR